MILQGSQVTQERLEKLNDFFVWCNPISPLQYFPEETNGILRVAESGDPARLIMISPMVMMGATGPVTLAGTLVQNNAEVLAGTVLAQLVGPGTPVIYGCVSTVMDLRTAENSLGHFETGMLNVAAVQMADHYGMPSRIAPGNTSVRKPGARAAVEAAMGLYMGLAAGGNLITTGLLDSLLMISYEHLILVDELIGHMKSVTGSIKTDETSLAVEMIQQHGHPSPGFLASDHTVRFMKRDVYYSNFTGRTEKSYQEWYAKAHDKVKEILDRGPSRKPADDYIDEVILERLAAVEARLAEDNATWRTGQDDWWQFYVQDFH
jgi:trimethylamine--corrinoid protein Co-methyltransferase